MAHNLLEECKERLVGCKACVKSPKPEKIWDEIYRILEFAFSAGDEISKAVDSLNPVMETFRHSNKAILDVYELVRLWQDMPWVVQEKFLKTKENSDIVEVIKSQEETNLERLVFEERRAVGEKLLKEAGIPSAELVTEYYNIKEQYNETISKIKEIRSILYEFRKLSPKERSEKKKQYIEQQEKYNVLVKRKNELGKKNKYNNRRDSKSIFKDKRKSIATFKNIAERS